MDAGDLKVSPASTSPNWSIDVSVLPGSASIVFFIFALLSG